jgi:hypothetical protein
MRGSKVIIDFDRQNSPKSKQESLNKGKRASSLPR